MDDGTVAVLTTLGVVLCSFIFSSVIISLGFGGTGQELEDLDEKDPESNKLVSPSMYNKRYVRATLIPGETVYVSGSWTHAMKEGKYSIISDRVLENAVSSNLSFEFSVSRKVSDMESCITMAIYDAKSSPVFINPAGGRIVLNESGLSFMLCGNNLKKTYNTQEKEIRGLSAFTSGNKTLFVGRTKTRDVYVFSLNNVSSKISNLKLIKPHHGIIWGSNDNNASIWFRNSRNKITRLVWDDLEVWNEKHFHLQYSESRVFLRSFGDKVVFIEKDNWQVYMHDGTKNSEFAFLEESDGEIVDVFCHYSGGYIVIEQTSLITVFNNGSVDIFPSCGGLLCYVVDGMNRLYRLSRHRTEVRVNYIKKDCMFLVFCGITADKISIIPSINGCSLFFAKKGRIRKVEIVGESTLFEVSPKLISEIHSDGGLSTNNLITRKTSPKKA